MTSNRFFTILISISLLLFISNSAQAFDWSMKLEAGGAVPLTAPQSHLFVAGGEGRVKALFGLNRYIDVGPTLGFIGLIASQSNPKSITGVGWEVGAGLRLKRPHDKGTISPWVDGDALYVRTGPLDRFGFSVGVGLSSPMDAKRSVWLGPYVRYLQIVQPSRKDYDNSDAKIIVVGVSLEVGSSRPQPVQQEYIVYVGRKCPAATSCPSCPVNTKQECPKYNNVVVKDNKIELKERIQFAWDKFDIQPVSYPVLNEVVKVLNDNKTFNVLIEGHASSEGLTEHNQELSENRAAAVLQYLVNHGVDITRLSSKGYGSSVPLESNDTLEGREANRRVVFDVELIIINKDSGK